MSTVGLPRSMSNGARKECATRGGGTSPSPSPSRSATKGVTRSCAGLYELSVTSFTSYGARPWRRVAIGRSTGVHTRARKSPVTADRGGQVLAPPRSGRYPGCMGVCSPGEFATKSRCAFFPSQTNGKGLDRIIEPNRTAVPSNYHPNDLCFSKENGRSCLLQ